jgi:cytochrome P450
MTNSTRENSHLPKAKGHFLLGQLLEMNKEGVYFYLRMQKEYGDAIELKFAHQKFYLFSHPEHNREILVEKPDQFIKGKQYNPLRLLLGNGLLTSTGEDWSTQRRMLNPLFGKDGMDILLTHIDRISKKYSSKFVINSEIDWSKHMFDYTLEVVFAAFFGAHFSEEEMSRMMESTYYCIRFVSRRMANYLRLPFFLPLKENREFRKHFNYLKETVEQIYNSRLEQTITPSNDMLDLLMRAEDSEGNHKKLSRDEIWDQLLSFLFAGHETTVITMSWLFYHLGKNPDVQKKIAEECARNNYQFENSLAMTRYPYLQATLNEIMRLYPPGWIISREAIEDATIGTFKIKKGQNIAISPLLTQRDPRWWKDPDEFIPERFLQGNPLYNEAPKNAFLPFSLGKRNCIGARFALIEMTLFCLNFFKEYQVESHQGPLRLKGYITLRPEVPIRLTVKKITS